MLLRFIVKFLAAMLAFLGALFLPAIILMFCLDGGLRPQGGIAPNGSMEARRVWGKKTFGSYADVIDDWVANSALIQSDVGDVQQVAPIGCNRYIPGFTDGAHAIMNLEVVGTLGTGFLSLPYVEVGSDGRLNSIGNDATWKIDNKTEIIATSGKSYLSDLGVEDIYQELVDLAQASEADQFLARFDHLESALTDIQRPVRRYGDCPQPIEALRDEYREPMLHHLGDMFGLKGQSDESAEVLRIAAKTLLQRAKEELQEPDKQRDMQRIAKYLSEANTMLFKANQQVPNMRPTLDLARYRVELWYLHSIGSRWSPLFAMGEEEEQRNEQSWAEDSLQFFYTESVNKALASPYLQNQVPKMKVQIDDRGQNRVYVNKHHCYAADVYLTVSNRQRQGSLMIRIRENEDRHEPIDLFAAIPRGPDYPLKTLSPYWTSDGSKRIKLSAKTGEPLSND